MLRDPGQPEGLVIDTHAHLDLPELASEREALLHRAARAGVAQIITVGIHLSSSEQAVRIAQSTPGVFSTVGIHPHGASVLEDAVIHRLSELAREPRVVAVGEIGLDYFRDRQPRDIQRTCLHQQIEIAGEVGLPVVFHVRDAFGDFLRVVSPKAKDLVGGVVHCFSGDWQVAKRCLDLGFTLSFPGTLTFKNAQKQHDVARRVPLDRILVETDAPFLAPEPYRGKTNEPAHVVLTARRLAELRGISFQELARVTTENARRLFRLPDGDGGDRVGGAYGT